MSNIERVEWQIAVCRDCGRHEGDPMDPCVCEPENGPKVMFSVEVVDAANLRGAVDPLTEAYDHLIHGQRDSAIVCIEHALVALGVDPATTRGQ